MKIKKQNILEKYINFCNIDPLAYRGLIEEKFLPNHCMYQLESLTYSPETIMIKNMDMIELIKNEINN